MVRKNAQINPACYGTDPQGYAIKRNDRSLKALDAIQTLIIICMVGFPIFYSGIWVYGFYQINFGIGEVSSSEMQTQQFVFLDEQPLFQIKGLEDFGNIANQFQEIINWMSDVDGLNISAGLEYAAGNNTELLEDMLTLINTVSSDVTPENIVEYMLNGSIADFLDDSIGAELEGMLRQFIEELWLNIVPDLIPDEWNVIQAFYIINNNLNDLTSWFDLTDVLLHADFTINNDPTIIFHNEADSVGGGESISADLNFKDIITNLITSISDLLVDLTFDLIFSSGSLDDIGNSALTIFTSLVESTEILFNIMVGGSFHFYGTFLQLELNLSEMLQAITEWGV